MISRRLTAWENLLDSVSHIGPLTTNPLEARGIIARNPVDSQQLIEKNQERRRNRIENRRRQKYNRNQSSLTQTARKKSRPTSRVSEEEEPGSPDNRKRREAQNLIKVSRSESKLFSSQG